MDSIEKMLRVKEVAGALGMGRDSVVRLIRRGAIKVVSVPRMGGYGVNATYLIPETELRAFLKRNMT